MESTPDRQGPREGRSPAVPVAEQSLWAHDVTSAASLVRRGATPSSARLVRSTTRGGHQQCPATTRDTRRHLLAALSSESARSLMQSRGFRDEAGGGPARRNVKGIDASTSRRGRAHPDDEGPLDGTLQTLGTLGRDRGCLPSSTCRVRWRSLSPAQV